jgi:ribosome maturation protein Sdo1
MKGQRKEVNTASTHIAIRLKKGGAGKGQTRFEVLINRSAYPVGAAKKKDHNWDMKEIVDEVFTNSAKLEPADKNLLDQCFPNKTKKEVILEILEKGEAQTSEVDRVQETAAQTEYFSQVAAAVTAAALMQEESTVVENPSTAAVASAAAESKQDISNVAKKGKKGNKDKAEEEQQPAPVAVAATKTNTKSNEPKFVHVGKDVIEREMKNARFKLLPGAQDKVSLDEQVNAAFLALSKNATIKIIRDQRIMIVDCEKQQAAQDFLHSFEEVAGKKPWKVLKTVTDKNGNQNITILFSADIKYTQYAQKPAGVTTSIQPKTHIPTSEEDDLSRFVPVATNTVKVVASAPAATAAAAKKEDEEKDNNDKKGGKDKKGGGAAKKKDETATASSKGKGGGGSLEDELAAITKKKGGNDDDSESSSDDDAPKMMVKKGKKR